VAPQSHNILLDTHIRASINRKSEKWPRLKFMSNRALTFVNPAISPAACFQYTCRPSNIKQETYVGRVGCCPSESVWVSGLPRPDRQTDGQTPDHCVTLITALIIPLSSHFFLFPLPFLSFIPSPTFPSPPFPSLKGVKVDAYCSPAASARSGRVHSPLRGVAMRPAQPWDGDTVRGVHCGCRVCVNRALRLTMRCYRRRSLGMKLPVATATATGQHPYNLHYQHL